MRKRSSLSRSAVFAPDPLRHVAGDLGEGDQLAVAIADRVDHHIGPKARTVPTHAPAFDFKTPGFGRGAQRALGHAGGAVLLGVEAREMRPDYLVWLVALDALGPGIPGRDPTLGIEQEDRVIGHALDQDPEELVGTGHQGRPGRSFLTGLDGKVVLVAHRPYRQPFKQKPRELCSKNEPQFRLRCNPPPTLSCHIRPTFSRSAQPASGGRSNRIGSVADKSPLGPKRFAARRAGNFAGWACRYGLCAIPQWHGSDK